MVERRAWDMCLKLIGGNILKLIILFSYRQASDTILPILCVCENPPVVRKKEKKMQMENDKQVIVPPSGPRVDTSLFWSFDADKIMGIQLHLSRQTVMASQCFPLKILFSVACLQQIVWLREVEMKMWKKTGTVFWKYNFIWQSIFSQTYKDCNFGITGFLTWYSSKISNKMFFTWK